MWGRSRAVYLREEGELLGGLCGNTFWDWLDIGQVWVRESHRVDTVSVQSPGFYEKLGYRVIGTLDDFPPGGQRFFMTKDLTPR